MWWIIIDSPNWLKNKKATINPINKKYNKCFQYTVTVSLNHEEMGKHSGRMTKIKPFMNKYNWKEILFPSKKDDWQKFEKNNLTIASKICPAYALKHNSNGEKQAILIMLPNGEGWHYLGVKKYQYY